MYPLVNDKLRETKHKISLVVTGGGSCAIDNILKYGGASSTLIDAYVPYDITATDKYLGFVPNQYCSTETSSLIAMEAFKRACELNDKEWTLGVGVTCKLAKISNEREGREHLICIAIQSESYLKTYEIIIGPTAVTERNQNLGRIAEEELTGDAIIMAIADCFGFKDYQKMMNDTFGKDMTYNEIIQPKSLTTLYRNDQKVVRYFDRESAPCIFSASFNPIHEAHLAMIKFAKDKYGAVDVELPIINAEKGAIGYADLNDRIKKIIRHVNSGEINNLILTTCPTFFDKSEVFQNKVFAIGTDTYNRISDSKFYQDEKFMNASIDIIRGQKNKFLVFQRKGVTIEVDNHNLERISEIVPKDEYVDCGVSSTQIREQEQNEQS